MAEVDISCRSRVGVGLHDRIHTQGHMPLKLAAPQTTIVAVDGAVVVLEHTRVDAIGAADGVLLWDERAFGLVGDGHAKMEFAVIVLRREDEIVLAVLLYDIAIPHLLLHPGHLVLVEDDAMIGDGTSLDVVERQHVVVAHLEVAAVVVEHVVALAVVGGIDVELAVKHFGRRVGHIIAGEKIAGFHEF